MPTGRKRLLNDQVVSKKIGFDGMGESPPMISSSFFSGFAVVREKIPRMFCYGTSKDLDQDMEK